MLDTCGYASAEHLKRILRYVEIVYLDLKFQDSKKHKKYTGKDNKQVQENASIIRDSGISMAVRFPLISGINDSDEDLHNIAQYTRSLSPSQGIHILPYHRLGLIKYEMLDKQYALQALKPPDKETLVNAKTIFEYHGLKVTMVI